MIYRAGLHDTHVIAFRGNISKHDFGVENFAFAEHAFRFGCVHKA